MEKERYGSMERMAKELEELRQAKAELEMLNRAALQIEQQLEESEEQYRSVTETSIDAIITADSSGRILTWNKGATHIFGHGPEIIGQPVTTIIPEQLRDVHTEGFERFLTTGERRIIDQRVELEGLHKNGDVFPIELSLSTWKSYRGRFFGAIIRDITERKRVERLREDVERIVRHDLKSPLVGIAGFAGLLLKSENLDEKQRKSIQMIRQLGEQMYNSLSRSMDLFKMERGTYRLKPAAVNLFALFDRLRMLAEIFARKKSITVSFHQFDQLIDPEKMSAMDYHVFGEESLLEVAFENLVKNAIEASPENAEVKINLKSDSDFHIIDFHNQGMIPVEIQNRFFEPYVTCGKEGGTGLGTHSARLAICTHGGSIAFTTSEREGTHVIVRLPRFIDSELNGAPPEIAAKC